MKTRKCKHTDSFKMFYILVSGDLKNKTNKQTSVLMRETPMTVSAMWARTDKTSFNNHRCAWSIALDIPSYNLLAPLSAMGD